MILLLQLSSLTGMVSKTKRQRSQDAIKRSLGIVGALPPMPKKSIHEKKVRPNMKGKHKIRLGHQSADIYEGFDAKLPQSLQCRDCHRVIRTIGFCAFCSVAAKASGATSVQQKEKTAKKAATSVNAKKKSVKR